VVRAEGCEKGGKGEEGLWGRRKEGGRVRRGLRRYAERVGADGWGMGGGRKRTR